MFEPGRTVDKIMEMIVGAILHKFGETSITVTREDLYALVTDYKTIEMVRNPDESVTFRLTKKQSNDPRLPLGD